MTAQPFRYPILTFALIAINILLFVVQVIGGMDATDPSSDDLIRWGANLAAYSLDDEPWRLLTSMFLHVGLLHLALNMYMLFAFGAMAERRFGAIRMLLVYLLSGLAGSIVSALWHADPFNQVVAAGASGALMGLTGAYLADWLVASWHNDPHEDVKIGGPLVQTIVINLVIGSVIPGIDNACHIGGLIGGFLVGGAFALVPPNASWLKSALAAVVICGAALAAMVAALRVEPSEGLIALREVHAAEKAEREEKEQAARAKAQRHAAVLEERKRGPRTETDDIAAGTSIALEHRPHSLYLMPDSQRIAVTAGWNAVQVVDLAARSGGPWIKGPRTEGMMIGCYDPPCFPNNPNALALAPDGRTAYAASMETDGIGIVDLETGKMTAAVKTGKLPRALVADAAGRRVYVVNDVANTVVAVDVATRKIVARSAVFGKNKLEYYHPVGIWLAAQDREVWVLDQSLSRLVVLDAATLAEVAEVSITSGYMNGAHFDAARGKAWVVGVDALDQIDLASKKVEKTAHFCQGERAVPVAIDRAASRLALAAQGRAVVVSLRTGFIVASYPYDGKPTGLQFAPDGKRLYVIGTDPQRLTTLDLSVTGELGAPAGADELKFLCSNLD
ncbi:rhomboid family intramembrane serine protease [Pseudoduganella chitinolytica]|uniref:Rhomboid family intramembrane serine protease n=1 Tax=Pseudoduganella chitinolytica TaxID=34070 RepID=A0ABY8BDA8_9BURK|nr:rhomboid family intramembrane serine protease [Pseudoduganella chitinolytica]WEF32722.1 rhomboid family intramembrane serine protease [Pseudoduganella chitinolytica]